MTPYYEHAGIQIFHGDCREVLPSLGPVATGVLTDPPYGLKFMGKEWDHGVPSADVWRLVLAALKPGAMLMAFGGTRTYHRLAVAIEDAGFEIRDTLCWLYGSGFPKSHDISKGIDKAAGAERGAESPHPTNSCPGGRWCKCQELDASGRFSPTKHPATTAPATEAARQWDGYGTALKPAWEPITLAMKPLDGTFAANALEHGVAGLNVDGGRIGTEEVGKLREKDPERMKQPDWRMTGGSTGSGASSPLGRWPANVLLDEESARLLDEQSGEAGGGFGISGGDPDGRGIYSGSFPRGDMRTVGYGDNGGASRFFYTAKVSSAERGNSDHPTMKPLALMRYLLKLLAPPSGGLILDPFMGSGTTLAAAKNFGHAAIGIEIEERYCEIAAERLSQEVLPLEVRRN